MLFTHRRAITFGGITGFILILDVSARSATVRVTSGFLVPGFGYLRDLISGYNLPSFIEPYQGNRNSSTRLSLNVAKTISIPSLDIQIAELVPRISSENKK